MLSPKAVHTISFFFGIFFVFFALYLAFFLRGSFFYTSFTLGSWLLLDYLDYRLNKTSILSYFYNDRHRHAFFGLFLISFFACFTVDFIWGVRILKMWEWVNYTVLEFLRMYLFMNITFVLGMYELYRVITTLLKRHIPEENFLHLRVHPNKKSLLYVGALLIGIIFLISPLYLVAFNEIQFVEYILILPFASISLITDSITYFTKGQPMLEEFIRINKLKITSLACTILFAFIVTEGLNYFGNEWRYLKMPFFSIQIINVPASVIIGWIPLTVGIICMINMTKHLSFISSKH